MKRAVPRPVATYLPPLLRDRASASRTLSAVARWPIRRIGLAHGEVIEEDAQARFGRAFSAYLAASSRDE